MHKWLPYGQINGKKTDLQIISILFCHLVFAKKFDITPNLAITMQDKHFL